MAATEHPFNDSPLPQAIALDADFVVSVISASEEFHRPCASFSADLLSAKVIIVHSPLLRFEFLNAWQKAVNKGALPKSLLRQQQLWDDPGRDRLAYYNLGDEYLADFLGLFERYEVRLSNRLQGGTRRIMALHGLRSMDACLVACAYQTGVTDIASLDKDFRRVDGIHLWNDFIPSKRQARRRQRS